MYNKKLQLAHTHIYTQILYSTHSEQDSKILKHVRVCISKTALHRTGTEMFNVSESTNRTTGRCRTSEFACLVQTPQSYLYYLVKKHFMVWAWICFHLCVCVCPWVQNSFMLVPLICLYKHEFGVPHGLWDHHGFTQWESALLHDGWKRQQKSGTTAFVGCHHIYHLH